MRDPTEVAPGRGVHLDPPELEFEAVLDPGPPQTRSVVTEAGVDAHPRKDP